MAAHDLSGRVVVLTGASRGIGWHTALALAEAGAHIVAIARTVGALEELDDAVKARGGSATLVPLDLRDYDALDRLGLSIWERWKKLDGFVANAGELGVITPVSHLEPKIFEQTMAVNVTANYRLIRSLEPLLLRSDAGRAVFVSSGAVQRCRPFWSAYSTSKAALEALVKTWAGEMATTPLNVNIVDPGPTRTAMRAKAMPGEDPETLPHPSELAPHIVRLLSPATTEHGTLFSFPTKSTTALLA